jgi:site-specific recombinase XerD
MDTAAADRPNNQTPVWKPNRQPSTSADAAPAAKLPAEPTASAAIVLERAEIVEGDPRPAAVYLSQLAPSGRRTMRTALKTIASIASSGALDADVFPWHLLRYEHTHVIRAALAEEYAPATANKHLAALRGALKAAWRLGLMSAEDYQRACDLEPVRGTRLPAGRSLPTGEIAALFNACAGGGPADVRDAALLGVLYGSGLRREEAVGLDLVDYNPEERQLAVRGKGGRQRLAHLAPGADRALGDWLALRGQDPGALFWPVDKAGQLQPRRLSGQAVRLILQRRARQAGVPPCSPHDLRRTYVSDLLDRGADVSIVKDLAGHASVTTTSLYDRRPERAKQRAAQLLHVPYGIRPRPEGATGVGT